MRSLPSSWDALLTKLGIKQKITKRKHTRQFNRKLRIEQCEDRRMLAVFTVSETYDAIVTSSGDAPGTLRQAIFDANDTDNLGGIPDEILFSPAVFNTPQTIQLTQGELFVTESVTIDAEGQDITISASSNSNIFTMF